MDDAEIEAVGLKSARTIDIDLFVPRERDQSFRCRNKNGW
jgi:non-homologous end joining protein Ku